MNAPHFLVVDDDEAFRNYLKLALLVVFEEAQVETAESVGEAIELIRATEFDVVLSDIQLGRVTGIDLVRQTRVLRPVPTIVLMTGDHRLLSEAMNSGAYACLGKPFERTFLKSVLSRAIEFNSLHRRADILRKALALVSHARPSVDSHVLVQLRIADIEKQMADLLERERHELAMA